MRYMPMLRLPVRGSRVMTQGRVMKRPPSRGQHWRMGNSIEGEVVAEDDFLAGRVFGGDGFGEDVADGGQLRQHL